MANTKLKQHATRTVNLLGALALDVSDAVHAAAERQMGHAGETPAALVALGHVPGLSNDALSKALGLSHAGCVRLIDRLAAEGLVERRAGDGDARRVALYLTRRGKQRRRRVLAERESAIRHFLQPLTGPERASLARLLEKMLLDLPQDDRHALAICRLCDELACPYCPVERARLEKGGYAGP